MIIQTRLTEYYLRLEIINCADEVVKNSNGIFSENDLLNFKKLNFSNLEHEFFDFNYKYLNFPHFKRVGIYDEFDTYSTDILASFIRVIKSNCPFEKKQHEIYCLVLNNILKLLVEDLKSLGDEEFAEFIEIECLTVLSWI